MMPVQVAYVVVKQEFALMMACSVTVQNTVMMQRIVVSQLAIPVQEME
jgi:hypothetical protein